MKESYLDLQRSLETGFIDQLVQSNPAYRPHLVLNDKEAGKKVLTTIDKELRSCDGFWFSVAFITTSGLATLMNTLTELEERNIQGKVLASQYLNFTHPEALRRLKQFSNIDLRIVTYGDFHSKGYLFYNGDLYNLIIGSSNLTADAFCNNKEWNLKVTAARESELMVQTLKEFEMTFEKATIVDANYLDHYTQTYKDQQRYFKKLQKEQRTIQWERIVPNAMQKEALSNITQLRRAGKRKALLISATGTGKTFLSAFDAKAFKSKKLLFVVHRKTIARKAMESYQAIFGSEVKMGMYTRGHRAVDSDFIFSTVQTISKQKHLKCFNPEHFDYIVIDETHRAGAESYQRLMDYFKPKFILGMTATPERTDGLDVFKLFDYNIAYEIRLQKALEYDMLCPFHYYGITDLTIGGQVIEDKADFNLLTSKERVRRILQTARKYGCDDGNVRGLVFCSRKEECHALSKAFNQHGLKTIALTGDDDESVREKAIRQLESNKSEDKIDYIFTVDIFNEGIDIPKVNQILMLRPTTSAIIFVQQLGRGLRKTQDKEYLTVVDFIGNYSNNYLVPIALYGDTSYNKDTLRRMLASGSELLPGTSTINFDRLSHARIFSAIDKANMQQKRDLVQDYRLLKYKLGRVPMMSDFIDHGSRDAYLYVNYSRSMYNFHLDVEGELEVVLSEEQKSLLEAFSQEINNAKRVEEPLLINVLLEKGKITFTKFSEIIEQRYGYRPSNDSIVSVVSNLNFRFVTTKHQKKLIPLGEVNNWSILDVRNQVIHVSSWFHRQIGSELFKVYLQDSTNWAIRTFESTYERNGFIGGFQLYKKYSRKDVFRILNWQTNPVAQNVGGYIVSPDESNCPVFVNYIKHEDISSTTKYEDEFLNPSHFQWMSKSKRRISSKDVSTILNNESMRIPLFIKKSNDEGNDFYFMGDVRPISGSAVEETMINKETGKLVPVVKMVFSMNHPVEEHLYNYLTDHGSKTER